MADEIRKAKPLPDRQDPDTAQFWAGTDKDELQVKRCDDCKHHHWPPRLGCPYCGSGKLAWVGGGGKQGTQRIYVDGKPASPSGFAASAPAFCDTEDGVRLVFTVSVGGPEPSSRHLQDGGGRDFWGRVRWPGRLGTER